MKNVRSLEELMQDLIVLRFHGFRCFTVNLPSIGVTRLRRQKIILITKELCPLRALKKLGYEVQVRAVCDLNYRNLGPLNFGTDHVLADHLTHYADHKNEPMHISEREKLVMSHQRDYLNQDPDAPQFHFTALDSPHYNYF